MDNLLTLYAVRNKKGEWFRTKGYGGSGQSWVSDIKRARIYGKLGPARSIVTFFTSNWPEYGIPDIIQFDIKEFIVMDEIERVRKSIKSKQEKEVTKKIRDLNYRMRVMGTEKENLQKTEESLKKLRERAIEEATKIGVKLNI